MNDIQLLNILERISHRDKSAFYDLYKDYYKLIFGVAISILKNEEHSKDVVQNVMLKLHTLPSEKFPSTCPMSWLYSVAKNETLQFLRKEPSTISVDEEFLEIQIEQTDIDTMIDLDSYYSMISSLKPQEQEIVTLKVISGLKYREIAKLLNIPMGTAQWKYNCAIHKLRIAISNLFISVLCILSGYSYWKKVSESFGFAGGDTDVVDMAAKLIFAEKVLFCSILISTVFLFIAFCFFIKHIKNHQQKAKHIAS